jgi:ABC-type multidrug transport system ATPase subunit
VTATALKVTGLRKRYGPQMALDGLDLEVPRGSLFGLVGSNGAGKTTLMSIVAGLVRPDAGHVDVLGLGPFDAGTHRGKLSLLPQDSRMPSYARAGQVLEYYARLQGMTANEARQAARVQLEKLRLGDRIQSPVRSLSHGMMRRLTVAQAFLGHPDLVILDEPTSGLDPAEVGNLRNLIRAEKGKQTVVISSHILSELEDICDHVAFIEKGKTVRCAALEDITHQRRMICYRLAPRQTLDLRDLGIGLPGMNWRWEPGANELIVEIAQGEFDPVQVNAVILPRLLQRGIGILEILRGSTLETEYIKARGKP